MIHLLDRLFGIVKESIYNGRGVLYLQITYYESKGKQRHVGNVVRHSLDYYNGRVEVTSLNYVGPSSEQPTSSSSLDEVGCSLDGNMIITNVKKKKNLLTNYLN